MWLNFLPYLSRREKLRELLHNIFIGAHVLFNTLPLLLELNQLQVDHGDSTVNSCLNGFYIISHLHIQPHLLVIQWWQRQVQYILPEKVEI